MPLYEYECPRTGKRFEVIQKFSDEPIKKCDDCDQYADCEGECKKLLSAPAIQFKGSGWYVTDYAGKGAERKEREGKERKANSGSDSGSGDSSKSDSSSKSEGSSKSDSSSKSEKSEKKEAPKPKKESSSSSKSDS